MNDNSTSFRKLNRKDASLTALIYRELRGAIIEGRLKPGHAMLEEQLATELDVSRTPLREALAMLKNEGLVESAPYRGTFVSVPTREQFTQIIQVRVRLESMAIELAIHQIPDREIARVRAFIQEKIPLLSKGDHRADMNCQNELHGLAPRYSGNVILRNLVQSLDEEGSRFLRGGDHFGPEDMLQSAKEHLSILDVYEQRDATKAIELMTAHLRASSARIKAIHDLEQVQTEMISQAL